MSGGRGSASRAAAGALRIGRTVGAALTDQRVLAATEARVVAIMGVVLLALAAAGIVWPLVLTIPLGVILVWLAFALLVRAHRMRDGTAIAGSADHARGAGAGGSWDAGPPQ